jgi:LysM repeat protein
MNTRTLLQAGPALLALALAGCGGDSASLSSEMDDSTYRDGQQMERQGRWDEALTAYLKVIDRRGDAAPESNLDAGIIYLNHIKDPVLSIYHFRRYLELEPNSKQAVYVRGLIDAAKREFARSLPGQPMEGQAEHMGIEDQMARLQRENDELRAENAALRAGVPAKEIHSSSIDLSSIPAHVGEEPTPAPEEAAASSSPISLAPVDGAGRSEAPAISDAPEEAAPAARPSPSVRHHVVARGDTLYSLAQKYLGNRTRWREIYAANKDLLPNEKTPLKIGMDLKMP